MHARTSITHPLRIETVDVPGTSGQIGMTLFPGRRDRLAIAGPWERDFDADLDVVRDWHPAVVVSLVEEFEFAMLGVPEFAERMTALARAGRFEWMHLPIRDAGVPGADFETDWLRYGNSIRSALRAGGRVLLHCRAGLGRTGMIAARLLVECGVSAQAAITSIKRARRGTIETKAQEEHVRQQREVVDTPLGVVVGNGLPMGIEQRFLGSLLGGAIGDALGAAFEFVSSARIEAALGGPVVRDYHEALPTSLMYPRPPGRPTDDTAMTIALLESLSQNGHPLTIRALHRGICDALARSDKPTAKMFWDGGPGGACIAMLHAADDGAGPFEGLNPQAGGNGAAMRAHVCGLFPDRKFVADFAALQAQLSHPHPGAVAAAQTIALIAHEGFYHARLATELPGEITDSAMIAAWEAAHRGLERGERLPAHLRDVDMAGWNTVSAAHAIALLYADDPATAIGLAAGSGRDTDTIASMVGAMLGAVHGPAVWPSALLRGLHEHEALERWSGVMARIAEASLGSARPFVELV